tara:strand:+ start:899 stop:2131 length:1233 start_codon:yes stop_codon:yes gene_type:complete
MSKRVVVTGMGAITPIGNCVDSFWSGIKDGISGIRKISSFDTSKFSVHIAGEVDIDLSEYFNKKELNRIDRFTAFASIATDEAINQSKINLSKLDKCRIGVIIGSGIGGISTFENQHKNLLKSPRRVSPFFIPAMISDIASGYISIKYGFKGPNYSVISACSTSNHAIGDSLRMIQYGDADVVVTGGSDACITPMAIAGFSNMKALTKNSDSKSASKPFDANRDGFVIAEGAGILVLEEYKHALNRNATILAELSGYSATGDAYHLTSPSPNGEGAIRAMTNALADAKINIEEIDYINAHGTSTQLNDQIETKAIKTVFGKSINNLSMSSTKSMTGHLLGAAGGIESIICISSILNNIVPPTINYKTPDPNCDIDCTPNNSINKNINTALNNTFGFGGHNAVLIFKNISN